MRAHFGRLPGGTAVDLITMHGDGVEVAAMTYGATIASLRTPDRHGRVADIALGFDTLAAYVEQRAYIGGVVGRYANRIRGASFEIDGAAYPLAANEGRNHLHGGERGFDKHVWTAEILRPGGAQGVVFSRVSPAGEEGYPGTLRVNVRYLLRERTLEVEYTAVTDAPTYVNLTQHTYFDLSGGSSPHVLDHLLQIRAAQFTPIDDELIPTGEIASVDETPFDFRAPARIGSRLNTPHDQLTNGRGYDHNWVLEGASLPAARVVDPRTRRTLEMRTTAPGLQFYSGNQLDGTLIGIGGRRYVRHSGFCLEPQHFPDSPHHPQFPPTRLNPGETYRSRTTLTFGVE